MSERIPSQRIIEEQAAREEWDERLDELEGFKNLSEKQQQMLRLSLYVNQRSLRGEKARKAEPSKIVKTEYDASYKHIWDWYCHAVIGAVAAEEVSSRTQ